MSKFDVIQQAVFQQIQQMSQNTFNL